MTRRPYIRTEASTRESIPEIPKDASKIRYRKVIQPTGDGTMTVVEYYRVDGGPEQRMLTVKAVRK